MRVLAFDTETGLIRPALLAPPLVCLTWQRPGVEPRITVDCKPVVKSWLDDPETLIVGHNVAYDLAVVGAAFPDLVPAIFAAYKADRVTDTQIRQQLLDLAAGCYRGSVNAKGLKVSYEYTLEALAKRCAGMQLQKDAWRTSYAEFAGLPLDKWPARALEVQARGRVRLFEAVQQLGDDPDNKALEDEIKGLRDMIAGDPSRCTTYPLDDARATLAVYEAQEAHAGYLADQYRQARAAFALHLSSAWGLRTDAAGIAQLRASIEAELADLDEELIAEGLVREAGTRDTKAAKRRMIDVCERARRPVPRTETHFAGSGKCKAHDGTPLPDEHPACVEHVCLDADACEASEDEILISYATRTTLAKQLSNDVPAIEKGTVYPVHTRYGFAATGRTTSSKPNIQNQSKRPGFREAFVPRPGYLFAACDFPGLELYTWAQCCKSWFGYSKMADALNAGLDPHWILASYMLGISYEEALARKEEPEIKRIRQQAKPGNFGFPGGMGVPKFVATTRKQLGRRKFEALGLTEERAKFVREKWEQAWPEARAHFARVRALVDNEENLAPDVETLFTKRHRGRATYCATANNGFQALGADCAKNAAWLIAEAQYTQPTSPLWNTRTVAFVHDEFVIEARDDERAHDAAIELARLMTVGANEFLPDVPIPVSKMEPLLMRRWSKEAKPRRDAAGRLVPW